MAQAFGGNRGLQPIPPEKGVFPLDHLQECKQAMREYMQCLKERKYSSERCRQLSKAYLECRMERNLMVKQDLNELGFKEHMHCTIYDSMIPSNRRLDPNIVNKLKRV